MATGVIGAPFLLYAVARYRASWLLAQRLVPLRRHQAMRVI